MVFFVSYSKLKGESSPFIHSLTCQLADKDELNTSKLKCDAGGAARHCVCTGDTARWGRGERGNGRGERGAMGVASPRRNVRQFQKMEDVRRK